MAAEFTGICCAAAIPLAAALRLDTSVLAALGALVVLATGARTLSGSHENWVEFSQIRYGIEREAALFLVGAAPYDGDDAVRSLVTRVEDLTAAGGERWAARRIHLAQASPPQLGGTDPRHTDGQQ